MTKELTQREKEVLREVVHNFILTAMPVGSKYISQKEDMRLSPATIRHVMSQLEEYGYLGHPHTSAGRVPTDEGYRLYIDSLIAYDTIHESERVEIASGLSGSLDSSDLLNEASKLLGKVSRQLSLVSAPYLGDALLTKIDLVSLNSAKILVVISLESGLIKTIVLEVESQVSPQKLSKVSSLLNERLGGLKLSEIRETISERVGDYADEALVSRFTKMSERIFTVATETEKFHIGMPQEILSHPEFELPENIRGILEILGDENVILHILEKGESNEQVTVKVGKENADEKLKDYSLITARYEVGGIKGTVGVVGPRRMQYSRLIPLVDFVAKVISNKLGS
ncbi:MAG TPA: heat-inducible transcriptional repressor HrcA [Candidatus Kryptonia bacterium]